MTCIGAFACAMCRGWFCFGCTNLFLERIRIIHQNGTRRWWYTLPVVELHCILGLVRTLLVLYVCECLTPLSASLFCQRCLYGACIMILLDSAIVWLGCTNALKTKPDHFGIWNAPLVTIHLLPLQISWPEFDVYYTNPFKVSVWKEIIASGGRYWLAVWYRSTSMKKALNRWDGHGELCCRWIGVRTVYPFVKSRIRLTRSLEKQRCLYGLASSIKRPEKGFFRSVRWTEGRQEDRTVGSLK